MAHSVDSITFPAEWTEQDTVQLTWPHADSDWQPYLEQVEACFIQIAGAIASHQKLIIITRDTTSTRQCFSAFTTELLSRITFLELPSNDTWSRDFGGLTVFRNGMPEICDFTFNGWGLKFPADKDNLITRAMYERNVFSFNTGYRNCRDFVLEGGSVESDGKGTILTTSACLLSPNRNAHLSRQDIELGLSDKLGADRILWLDHGYLAGDDTDSHIDTLARFCNVTTICYVECSDQDDEHFIELQAMKKQLEGFSTAAGSSYTLVPLPMAEPVFSNGERLPATYANFLIINGAVLCPTYGTQIDKKALDILAGIFPEREIIGIDCSVLIKQHGSLHCVTMQYPEGVIR